MKRGLFCAKQFLSLKVLCNHGIGALEYIPEPRSLATSGVMLGVARLQLRHRCFRLEVQRGIPPVFYVPI